MPKFWFTLLTDLIFMMCGSNPTQYICITFLTAERSIGKTLKV